MKEANLTDLTRKLEVKKLSCKNGALSCWQDPSFLHPFFSEKQQIRRDEERGGKTGKGMKEEGGGRNFGSSLEGTEEREGKPES